MLQADRGLAAGVPAAQRDAAERASFASLIHVNRGAWAAPLADGGGHGLLVLDGFLVRAVAFRNRFSAEVLGPGDLLHPDVDDESWSRRMSPFPEVTIALTGRALLRSRRMAATVAIMQCRQLEARLHLVLWSWARWRGSAVPAWWSARAAAGC